MQLCTERWTTSLLKQLQLTLPIGQRLTTVVLLQNQPPAIVIFHAEDRTVLLPFCRVFTSLPFVLDDFTFLPALPCESLSFNRHFADETPLSPLLTLG